MGAPDVNTRGIEACRLLEAGFRASGNQAVSVAAALEEMPESPYPITLRQPRKKATPFRDKYLAKRKQYYAGKNARRGQAQEAGKTVAARKDQPGAKLRKGNVKNAKKSQEPRKHAYTRNRKKSGAS